MKKETIFQRLVINPKIEELNSQIKDIKEKWFEASVTFDDHFYEENEKIMVRGNNGDFQISSDGARELRDLLHNSEELYLDYHPKGQKPSIQDWFEEELINIFGSEQNKTKEKKSNEERALESFRELSSKFQEAFPTMFDKNVFDQLEGCLKILSSFSNIEKKK